MHPPATRLDVERLLRERRVGHTLPGPCYVDPDVHRLDLERIWYREWIFVAHAADVPEPGSYVTVAVGDHRIVIVRGGDDRIRAMHNVCRHRGSLVCTETAGTARRRLVCPYHQWSYGRDGSLHTAPMMDGADGFDIDACRLPQLAVEEWEGFVFVSMHDDPTSLAPQLEPLTARLEQ